MSKQLGTARESVYSYIAYLEQAGIFNLLFRGVQGKKIIRKPEKIYMENSNLVYLINRQTGFSYEPGTIREIFFANQVKRSNRLFAGEDADFKVNDTYVFEVGGKSKGAGQVDLTKKEFLVKDGIEMGFQHIIPLWLFGMLY